MSEVVAPGPLRTLAASTFVNNVGNGAFAAAAVVYLNRVVGLPAASIGLGLTVAAVGGLLASVPAGMLADRTDPARAAGLLAVAAGVVSAAFAVVDNAWAFVVVATAFALCERASVVGRQTLVGTTFTGAERTSARAVLRSVSNVGAALGTGVAALVLTLDSAPAFRLLFGLNALTFVLAGILLLRVRRAAPAVMPVPPPGEAVATRSASPSVLRDHAYAVMSVVNALLTIHVVVLDVVLPLWVVNRTDAPTAAVAALFLANTVLVVLLQLPVSRRFETLTTAIPGLRVAAALVVAMFLLLALSSTTSAWVTVVVLALVVAAQTGAEMVQGATSWPISYDLAPPERIGEYQGFFGVAEQVVQIIGPAALTLVVVTWNGPGPLVLAGAFAVLALVAPAVAQRLVPRRTAHLAEV